MRLHLLQIQSLTGIPCKDLSNKINNLLGEVDRELNVDFQDLVVGLVLVGGRLEGGLAGAELVAQDTKAPDVGFLVVELARYDLWGHVVQSAAECLALARL